MRGREPDTVVSGKKAFWGFFNGVVGTYVYEFIITFAIYIGIMMFVTAQGYAGEDVTSEAQRIFYSLPYSLIITILGYLAILIVFVLIFKFGTLLNILKKIFTSSAFGKGILTFLCILIFEINYNLVAKSLFNMGEEGNANQQAVVKMISENYFLGFIGIVILGPIVEELTYRYCLFGGLKRKSKTFAYLISTIVFAGMHFVLSFVSADSIEEGLKDLVYLPTYIFSALALCFVYDHDGVLGNSIVAHILNNALSFIAIALL